MTMIAEASRLEDLTREFRQRAGELEELRTMPADLVASARAHGLFRMAMATSLGGLGHDPLQILSTVEQLSSSDGAAGWTVLIGNSTAFFAWLDQSVATAMLAEETDVISTSMFAPLGQARLEGGDLVIDGRWPFNSGCLHADWYQLGVMVMDGDRPALRPDGRPDLRFAFLPSEQATVIDTWHSIGLRGTGSHDVEVRGLRIPVDHAAAPMLDPPAADGGPLAHLGFFTLLAVLMTGFPLGVGRRALDEFATLAPTKRRGSSPTTVAEDAHVQHEVGRAEAGLLSARALAMDTIGAAWESVASGDPVGPALAARVGLAAQHAMQAAVVAVDTVLPFAGAGAVYTGHPLERCFRDLHTANQHIAFSGDGFRGYARHRFGIED